MSKLILVDADVVSHFIYAGEILVLPRIFPHPIKVLDKVFAELSRFPNKKQEVENLINFKLLEIIPFPEDDPAIVKEYFYIKNKLFKGEGESACMAVVRHSKDILASSNLRDIKHYCDLHSILYLTTMDFLCHALNKGMFDMARCNAFIKRVLDNKNKMPAQRMEEFDCRDLSAYLER